MIFWFKRKSDFLVSGYMQLIHCNFYTYQLRIHVHVFIFHDLSWFFACPPNVNNKPLLHGLDLFVTFNKYLCILQMLHILRWPYLSHLMQWSLFVPFIGTLLLNKGDYIWIQNNHARIDNLILYSTYTVFNGAFITRMKQKIYH